MQLESCKGRMSKPNLELLGQTIRGFRERAGISKYRLAQMMVWRSDTPLRAIEDGRRRPEPDTLNLIAKYLDLNVADTQLLHGFAGYVPDTVLPPIAQIKRVLYKVEANISQRPYPAYVVDYLFRYWAFNPMAVALSRGRNDYLISVLQERVAIFDVVFHSQSYVRGLFIDHDLVEREQVFRYKIYNILRRHEGFYLAYPQFMSDRLHQADYERFRVCWNSVDVHLDDSYFIHPSISFPFDGDVACFELHNIPIPELNDLFYIVYYEPKSGLGNVDVCNRLLRHYAVSDQGYLRLWDYVKDEGIG